ncbi:MAG: hypothetical protein H7841_01650 [Magnetospirillum sp. WYHS-4]
MILKLYDAMEHRDSLDTIVRELSREDMLLLADQGASARETCWGKGFVMVVGRKIADIAKTATNDAQMRTSVERTIVQMDALFTKLPKGISIDLSELAMEVFNQACELLAKEGSKAFVSANVVGQACGAVNLRKQQAKAKKK